MNLLHRVIVQDQLIAADGVFTYDMGTNPLSVVLIMLRPLNDNAGLVTFANYRAVVGAINRCTLQHRGASVISGSGTDLAVLNYLRHDIQPLEANPDDADNERRAVCLPLLLGRKPWSAISCFPATTRGELILELDLDIADTGYDGLRLSIETIEIIGATPREFERKITTAQTFAATGENDVFLPVGNVVRGLLLFGTTTFTGASPAPTWGRISTLLDGRAAGYSSIDFETAIGLPWLLGRSQRPDDHIHRLDGSSVVVTLETYALVEAGAADGQWCYLDFDPHGDDMLSVDTRGATQWVVRGDAETANAARVVQVERMVV
jgi:hypothetical protein